MLVEQIQARLARREYVLAVARLARLVVSRERHQPPPLAFGLGVLSQRCELRPRRNVLELDPVGQDAQERNRFVNRQVSVGVRAGRDGHIKAGVELEAHEHPADRIEPVARDDAQMVPGAVRKAGRKRASHWRAKSSASGFVVARLVQQDHGR